MRIQTNYLFLICLTFTCLPVFTPYSYAITVTDDTGKEIVVAKPVNRIVSLAPHVTELLFAAGAGEKIVAVVKYSNFPEAANRIEQVGDTYNIDIEKVLFLNPDLIVAWQSGGGTANIERLISLGLNVYLSEPKTLDSIANTIKDLGALAGTEDTAIQNSTRYLEALYKLKNKYANRKKIRVFYQIWHQPIFTVNGDHIISKIIELCGGQNIFASLPALSPQISSEAVLEANPQIIIASGRSELRPGKQSKLRPEWLDQWLAWPTLEAVKNKHLYYIPPELIQRHTPRILEGTEMMCGFLEQAR